MTKEVNLRILIEGELDDTDFNKLIEVLQDLLDKVDPRSRLEERFMRQAFR